MMNDDDFQPLFTAEAAEAVLQLESTKHKAINAAYGAILTRSKSELAALLTNDASLYQQAPELIEWLGKFERISQQEAHLMMIQEAGRRLAVVLYSLSEGRTLH